MKDVWPLLQETDFPAIRREQVETLQMNLGYLCNLSCVHCHVAAGPKRKELMDQPTMALALQVAEHLNCSRLDLTGGSPEMNPAFRWLVEQARQGGLQVMDRLNPTIMEEPGYEWVGEFLADHKVEVVASLPCYSRENVDAQRGNGVFEASIKALKTLNGLGYGQPDSDLKLNLVYNPLGPVLPPAQGALEREYKQLLKEEFGLIFNHLFTITNMPIQRFGSMLVSKGQFDDYLQLLRNAYQPENLKGVMCRHLISVDYQGYVYDCDFNQMLGLPLGGQDRRLHLQQLLETPEFPRRIGVGEHCYGCTAGQGSSCGGALSA